nr:DeoR/GlpR family DNA-binding transcription regulator [uncultured Trichococcus sp.]
MGPEERRSKIVSYIQEVNTVRIQELSKRLKVTRETIRKDLYHLQEAGVIIKTHGGAILEDSNHEVQYAKRQNEHNVEKETIARLAATYIEPGDCIYLDYGTTTYALAQEIRHMTNISVVTNTIPIINVLINNPKIEIIIPGGVVRKNENSMYGQFAINSLKDVYVKIGFFGCGGIDPKIGITNHHINESLISAEMIKKCQTAVLLADHSKFGNRALNRSATLDDVDIIITDRSLDVEIASQLMRREIEVCIAK